MAAQGERVPGVVDMCSLVGEPMAQDEDAEQEMLVVEEQEQSPPQMDPEPEMGAAAAYDTSPPPLHQNPPILAESAQLSTFDMAQLMAMLAGMRGETRQMNEKMDGNAQQIKKKNMEEMRGEMRQMGHGLQAGIMAIVCRKTRTASGKMAAPRAGTSELRGSATAVRPVVEAGEDRVIWETCRARSEKREGNSEGDTRGKINWGDGDV